MSEVDDFLAHYGVPGMKWGKRNARRDDSSGSSRSAPKAPKAPMSRNKKIAIGVGIGAIALIGAGVAAKSMNKNMNLPISSIANTAQAARGKAAVNKIVVPRPPTIGTRPSATAPKMQVPRPPTIGSRSSPSAPRPSPSAPRSGGASLDLGRPAAAQRPPTSPGLNLGTPSRNTSPSFGGATGPSLGDLNSIINSGPKVVYDRKTGQYKTR